MLEQFLYQGHINRFIGTDLSTGFDYRPLLSENVSFIGGVSVLLPGQGFRDIYDNFSSPVSGLFAGFLADRRLLSRDERNGVSSGGRGSVRANNTGCGSDGASPSRRTLRRVGNTCCRCS